MKLKLENSAPLADNVVQYGHEKGGAWWLISGPHSRTLVLVIRPADPAQLSEHAREILWFQYPYGPVGTFLLRPMRCSAEWPLWMFPVVMRSAWYMRFVPDWRHVPAAQYATNRPGFDWYYQIDAQWKKDGSRPRKLGRHRYIPADDMPAICVEMGVYLCDYFYKMSMDHNYYGPHMVCE